MPTSTAGSTLMVFTPYPEQPTAQPTGDSAYDLQVFNALLSRGRTQAALRKGQRPSFVFGGPDLLSSASWAFAEAEFLAGTAATTPQNAAYNRLNYGWYRLTEWEHARRRGMVLSVTGLLAALGLGVYLYRRK